MADGETEMRIADGSTERPWRDQNTLNVFAALMAETAANTSLIRDMLMLVACFDPIAIGAMRDEARVLEGDARSGKIKGALDLDVVTYHSTRHALLEEVMTHLGQPHRPAEVIVLNTVRQT